MNAHTLPDLVHACFDERRDPLDDARVVAWLEAHPEALEDVAELRARLGELTRGTPHGVRRDHARDRPELVRRRPRRRTPWLVAAGLLGLAGGVFLVAKGRDADRPSFTVLPITAANRFTASLVEEPAPCGATLTWRTREVLADTPDTQLAIVELRSIRR